MRFSVIVPTYNAGVKWEEWLDAYKKQTVKPVKTLIIDSSSEDDTVNKTKKYGYQIVNIRKKDFNHGRTRQFALEQIEGTGIDVIVFLTQDAVLATSDALGKLISAFEDKKVTAVYGRQLPRHEAGHLERFERLYNYPGQSVKKVFSDKDIYGVKTPFISNSFAAYRIKTLREVGGFPSDVIMAEDMSVAAKMLMAGWGIYYCSEATVYHSHDYNLRELFSRYFDTGVFHNRESWIQENFGKADGEGKKYVLSEIRFLWSNKPSLIPYSILRNIVKWLGYRIGLWEDYLPHRLKRALSMHTNFWN